MSIKKTVILFIILVLMGAYYYTQVNLSEKQQAEEEAARKLFNASEETIQEITLQRQNEKIVLEKQEETWKMIQPVEDAADTDAVKRMVMNFVNAEQKKTIADDSSKDQEFGLDKPQLIVNARGQDGNAMYLAIGSETPTASGYYAHVDNQPQVIAISSQIKTGLDKSLYDLRDKTILAFEPTQVKKAILTLPSEDSQTVELEQKNDTWKIVAPQQYQADTEKMNSFLSKITSSQVKAFITEKAEDLTQYGLEYPTATLSLMVGEDKSQKTLFLGKKNESEEGVYAKHEAMENVFLVDATILDEFPKQINDLRDKTLLAFNNAGIQKIELRSQEESIVLEREAEEDWAITQPQNFAADWEEVRQLLSNARSLTVQQFINDAPQDLEQYGLASPVLTIRLWEQEQEIPHELLLGSPDPQNAGMYAKVGNQDSVVLVKTEALEQLHKTVFELRERKILAFERDKVAKFELHYADQRLVLEKDGDEWQATEPEQKSLAMYKVNNLLYDLSDLKFTQKLTEAEADLSKYGLADPEIRITLHDDSGNELLTLLVGRAVEGQETHYVKLDAEAVVYAIDPQFLQELPKTSADLEE